MLKVTNKTKLVKVVALYTMAMSAISSAYAQDAGDVNQNLDGLELINNVINNSSTGVVAPNINLANLPSTSDFTYTSNKTDSGITGSAYAAYRSGVDFNTKYINTSSENVTVLNISAGFSGGAKLGCSGLDMGLEALFEFEVGDILEYLPKYILTNLATEALAQIYATPLVSSVMDGLKSMQNFTAEFKQASCNMNEVLDRATEIKKARYQECIEEHSGENTTEAAEAICSDPEKQAQKLRDFLNSPGQLDSTGTSIGRLLTKNGYPYGDSNTQTKTVNGKTVIDTTADGYIASGITTGALMKMFIPDIQVSVNGGSADEISTKSKINLGVAYNKAFNTAYNTISGIYGDLLKSIQKEKISNNRDIGKIVLITDQYRERLMKYGSNEVITDSSSAEPYTTTHQTEILNQFESLSKYQYKTSKSSSGYDEFKIGPASSVKSIMSSNDTDLIDEAKNLMLKAGMTCFVKSYEKPEDTNSKYSWMAMHDSEMAVLNITEIEEGSISDEMITRLSECKAIDMMNLPLIRKTMSKGEDVGTAYIKYLASKSAYATGFGMVKVVTNQLDLLISKQPDILKKQCEKEGVANLEKTAVYDDATGQQYKTCDDYIKQNKMGDEKIASYRDLKDKLILDMKALEVKTNLARENFQTLMGISEFNNLSKSIK